MPKTYEPIATQTLGSTQTSITFSSIPQTYTDLILISSARRGITGSGGDLIAGQLNSDTGSNYSRTGLFGDGSTASSGRSTNISYFFAGICGDNKYSTSICQIQNYSNSSTFKTALARLSDGSDQGVSAQVNLWRSTSAISSIYIFTTAGSGFFTGSTFTLYGIKAA